MPIHCAAWPQNRSVAVRLGTVLCFALASGCSDDSHRLGGAQTANISDPPRVPLCSEGAELEIIDQMEDGDGTIEMTAQRSGVWFSFNDKTGGTQQPASDAETFAMSRLVPPRSGSRFAAHSQGTGFTFWGAGIGFELYSQKAYDVSRYAGIVFWARRAPNTASTLRFAVTDVATAPRGRQCRENETCSDYFGSDVTLETEFQRYDFSWRELKQVGWGEPKPDSVDTTQIYGLRFQAGLREDFDFWIDDIALICNAD